MASRIVPDAEWDIVRAAFEAGRETVAAIGQRHGLHPLVIYGRARRLGWIDPRRPVRSADALQAAGDDAVITDAEPEPTLAHRPPTSRRARRPVRRPAKAVTKPRLRRTTAAHPRPAADSRVAVPREPGVERSALIARLFKLIALRLDRMEKEMTSDDPDQRSDSERETRAIGTIAQSIERLTELETDRTRGTKQRDGDNNAQPGPLGPEETQRLSIALAERLERLAKRTRRD